MVRQAHHERVLEIVRPELVEGSSRTVLEEELYKFNYLSVLHFAPINALLAIRSNNHLF
jgi:hypothetical protein